MEGQNTNIGSCQGLPGPDETLRPNHDDLWPNECRRGILYIFIPHFPFIPHNTSHYLPHLTSIAGFFLPNTAIFPK